jgi:long-chain acyl-CoA synthetase
MRVSARSSFRKIRPILPRIFAVGPQTVQYILAHTGAGSVVCTREQLDKICETKRSGLCPAFTTAILVDGVTPEASKKAIAAGLVVVSFAKVEAVGAQTIATVGHKHSPPSFDDIATFSYTSGTTGVPKGALITHGNIISAMSGMKLWSEFHMQLTDRHLSYLPLAHIFERVVMAQALAGGASVAFFRGDPLLLIEDMQACRPTILPVAPRVLNKIYDKVCCGRGYCSWFYESMFPGLIVMHLAF